ncbi:Cytochrome P450 9a20, partial [Caligus rogercresseyi]
NSVYFPNSAFGMSEEHFNEPDKFDPNNFSDDEKRKLHRNEIRTPSNENIYLP